MTRRGRRRREMDFWRMAYLDRSIRLIFTANQRKKESRYKKEREGQRERERENLLSCEP